MRVKGPVVLGRATVEDQVLLSEATVKEQVSLDGATVRHVTNCHDSAGTSYSKPPRRTQDPKNRELVWALKQRINERA